MLNVINIKLRREKCIKASMVAVALTAFFVMQYSTRNYITGDTWMAQVPWWNHIAKNGWNGVVTLNQNGGNYTTIWYFIISIICRLNLYPQYPVEYSIKGIGIICTLLSTLCMYHIAKHYRPKSLYLPIISAITILFLPAFFFDILKTNLPDTVYLVFCLYSFLCFIKNKKWAAWLLLGFGACFKLMAIYLAPVYIYFYIKDFRKAKLLDVLSPFFGFLSLIICSMPHVIFGGRFFDAIIKVVLSRGSTKMDGHFTLWRILPSNQAEHFKLFSFALVMLILLSTAFFIYIYILPENRRKVEMPLLPVLSTAVCFFILPAQLEGYFALASVFALIGFIITPQKPFFVIFTLFNSILFFAYAWIGFNWWEGNSVYYQEAIIRSAIPILFAFTIGYCYYVLFKHSTLYSKAKSISEAPSSQV